MLPAWITFRGNIFNENLTTFSNFIDNFWLKFPPASNYIHWSIVCFITVIFAISVLGNGLVIITCFRCKSLHLANALVINLAITDCLLPITTYWMLIVSSLNGIWAFGKNGCLLYGFLQGYFGLVSLVTISAMSARCAYKMSRLNRCVNKGLLGDTSSVDQSDKILITLIWVYCAMLVSPPLFGYSTYTPTGYLTSCCFDYLSQTRETRGFILFLFVFGFVVPFSTIIFSYSYVFCVVRRTVVQRTGAHEEKLVNFNANPLRANVNSATNSKRCDYQLKVFKIIAVVLLAFMVAWLPYACLALIGQFDVSRYFVTPLTATAPAILAKTSTVYNPIIYAYLDNKFRQAMVRTVFVRISSRSG